MNIQYALIYFEHVRRNDSQAGAVRPPVLGEVFHEPSIRCEAKAAKACLR